MFSDILEQKNAFLDNKNNNLKNSKKWDLSYGQNLAIFHVILVEIEKKYVFYDILERKHTFEENKNQKEKKSKKWHFPKGVSLWF